MVHERQIATEADRRRVVREKLFNSERPAVAPRRKIKMKVIRPTKGKGKYKRKSKYSKKTRKGKKRTGNRRSRTPRRRGPARPPSHALNKTTRLGQAVTSTTSMFIGHATALTADMIYLLCGSIMKRLSMEMKSTMLNVLDDVGADTEVGSAFRIKYKTNPELLANTIDITYTVGAGTTWENIIAYMVSNLPTTNDQLQILEARYIPKGYYTGTTSTGGPSNGGVRINLEGSRFIYQSTSEFKVQNRTVAVVGDREEDNVTQCPLLCKVYDGSGTGTTIKAGTPGQQGFIAGNQLVFVAKADSGIIAALGGATEQFNSPPPKSYFPNVKKCAQVSITPGEIKLSTLQYKKSFSMSQFADHVFGDTLTASQRKIKPLGNFRMFGIQKFMDVSNMEGVVSVALENRTTQTAWITLKNNVVTAPINRQTFLAAIGP
jgi:hypothetical protein